MPARNANRRRRPSREAARRRIDLRRPLLAGGVLALTLSALALALGLLDRPLHAVVVEGAFQRLSPLQLEAAMKPALDAGFLSVDLVEVRRRLVALPWVDSVQVRRQWPHSLEVTVLEQVAAARWGRAGLLNMRGELFVSDARHVPAELPRLSGPEETEVRVAARYLGMRDPLLAAGLRIRELHLDARGAWRIQLDNGLEVRLGRRDTELRLQRFVALVTPLVTDRFAEVVYVDMRYSSGFAIGWRAGAGPGMVAAAGKDTDV